MIHVTFAVLRKLTPSASSYPMKLPPMTRTWPDPSAFSMNLVRARQIARHHSQRGPIRKAPSRRTVSPFNNGFSMMCAARRAYSLGRPSRLGCGT